MIPPIIIAHRGASGYRPEHTLAAYELAINQGADYIEPDLVMTQDGVLIARHENEISETTNIQDYPEFAQRKISKLIDGELKVGWFTEDFTLSEIKQLRAKERIPELRPQNQIYQNQLQIPTFREILDLVKQKNAETGRNIGIYPETKHPTYFRNIGLSLEEKLIEILDEYGYKNHQAKIFIQSFEVSNLKYLAEITDLQLVQLINDKGTPYDFQLNSDGRSYKDLISLTGLKEMSNYAAAIGVNKNLIVPRNHLNQLLSPTTIIQDAHQANLSVHAWTFRDENYFLPLDYQNNPQNEYQLFFNLGIDGVFSDNSDTAIQTKNYQV
ncbi:glycerophosphodiester phosphodiesterase [Calothrix sp. PCC 6303]|uniref:glycerophosphodiester phosphodiesterase n=1 Tax=Calothrix sp. PCC 6303 TaxID=1170562 RepID=UPI0002A0273E|nr:glycerophosphodiester phosphodiesterase [Calothrix sp. PCC 6303]AFZ02103.1 glycerophosphoryl diester phosphodiesterase [Calothrix sp. PCC 6303]